MQVKSKYKNPDKYIEKLKIQLERNKVFIKLQSNRLSKARGSHWFTYEDGVTTDISLTTEDLRDAKLNQEVIIQGRISGYEHYEHESPDKHIVTLKLGRVALKEDS